jgi:Family of unknown function (DUF6308)
MPVSNPVIDIRLPSGLLLRDAAAMLRAKFRQWSWHRLDGIPLADPHVITDTDVDASFRGARARTSINRVSYKAAFRKKQEQISGLLRSIPADIGLEDADLNRLRAPIVGLYDSLMAMKGVKLANATKVTYRHRPRLLPIIDSALEYYYWYAISICNEDRWLQLRRVVGWGDYAFALLSLFREDLCAVIGQVDQVREAVRDSPFASISRVRVLEALIWHYYFGR